MKLKERFNKKLLVEGNDDQHVLFALCEKHEINECFDIIDCEGIENLLNQLPIRFKQSEIETIGIILDADSDIDSRWSMLRNMIMPLGFEIPDLIPNEGLILTRGDDVKIGIWIMPNNDISGMLEDFIAFLVPENDKLLPIVEKTLIGIEEQGINKYSLIHKSKAKIHFWLALQEDPGIPMGLSITKRYLTTENENCIKLMNWLNSLYG